MASITPLSALPANGVTPAGTLTLSNAQGRLTCFLSAGSGAATLRLITMTEGGNWGYVEGGELVVNSQSNLGDNVGFLDFTNASTTTKYHCILNSGSASVSAWLSALTGPGTSTALVAHAASHLSGGADDLLGSPGNVGDVTPGTFAGTFGPDGANQNTVPSVNGQTFIMTTAAQTLTNKTLTAPVINGATSASGNFDLSGSTGTFKTSTGAVTIGGGANAITATSSAAAITLTAGAASTWSTSAGALNLDGFAGINLKLNTATLVDVGATSATAVTLAANISLNGAAGTGGVSLGSLTGNTALPTGNLAWAAAATKTLSLAAAGAAAVTSSGGALTLTGALASTWSTSAGALTVSGFAGINLQINGTTVCDVGATTAANLTMAANKSIALAAGTGGISAGSATGATALPTGNVSWTGAAGRTLALAADGAASVTSVAGALTLTAAAASTWSTSAGGLTLTSAAAATWSTAAGALTVSGFAGINLQVNGTTVCDVGATAATAVTLAANKSLVGAAGTGAVTLGSMTGDMTLPTGAVSWAGAANKNLSLVAQGTGTLTLDNATTWSIGATNGGTGTLGRSGQLVTFQSKIAAGAAAWTIADPGNAGAIPVTASGVAPLTSAGAETRTIAIPSFIGQKIAIICDVYVGDIVITSSQSINQAGNTIITLGAAADMIELTGMQVGGALRWRVTANDGAALS